MSAARSVDPSWTRRVFLQIHTSKLFVAKNVNLKIVVGLQRHGRGEAVRTRGEETNFVRASFMDSP